MKFGKERADGSIELTIEDEDNLDEAALVEVGLLKTIEYSDDYVNVKSNIENDTGIERSIETTEGVWRALMGIGVLETLRARIALEDIEQQEQTFSQAGEIKKITKALPKPLTKGKTNMMNSVKKTVASVKKVAPVMNDKTTVAPVAQKPLTYSQSKKIVQRLGIKNHQKYYRLRDTQKLPNGLPSNPATAYARCWQSWDHFLGAK